MNKDEFFDPKLLQTEYVRKFYDAYQKCKGNPYRSYQQLLEFLVSIHAYREDHAYSFVKRIKTQQHSWKDCEAVFTEIIVYHFYLKLIYEGLVASITIKSNDYDLKIERLDGSCMFCEAFCIMPNIKMSTSKSVVINDIQTHMQEEFSSIRQKLLGKMKNQKQLVEPRENYAIIELNDYAIAGDFSILSSLSDGYKINFDRQRMEVSDEGYDWSKSIFDETITENLKGIIYFSLGNYQDRKLILNPNFKKSRSSSRKS